MRIESYPPTDLAPSGRPLEPRQMADTVYQLGLVGAILLLLWTTF